MTPYEIELARALYHCSFLPYSAEKRFARNMFHLASHAPGLELSLRQRHYMELMAWRYRRQLPARFVPDCKPLDLPPKQKPEAKKRTKKIKCADPASSEQIALEINQ